jgi:hypothetical protein
LSPLTFQEYGFVVSIMLLLATCSSSVPASPTDKLWEEIGNVKAMMAAVSSKRLCVSTDRQLTHYFRGARTRRFITVFTTSRHQSLSWAKRTHPTLPQPISLRSILIPSYHLRLGLSSGLFRSGFPIKTFYKFLSSPMRATCLTHLISLDFICLIIFWGRVQNMKILTVQFPPFSSYFIPLWSKCSPSDPVLKHPQSMLFP